MFSLRGWLVDIIIHRLLAIRSPSAENYRVSFCPVACYNKSMTDTDTENLDSTLDPGALEGKTRAELLDLCKARGLKASAWKRDRMFAELTGSEAPAAPVARENKLAQQLEARETVSVASVQARLALRTGRCVSQSGCKCEKYEADRKDAFGWQTCECGHTNWSHDIVEPGAAEEEGQA